MIPVGYSLNLLRRDIVNSALFTRVDGLLLFVLIKEAPAKDVACHRRDTAHRDKEVSAERMLLARRAIDSLNSYRTTKTTRERRGRVFQVPVSGLA